MRKNTSRSASGRGSEDTVKERLEQLKHERFEKRHHGEMPSAENEKIAEALASGGSFVENGTDGVQGGNSAVNAQSGKVAADKQTAVKRGSGRRSVQNIRTKTSFAEKQQENRSDNKEEQKSTGETRVAEESKQPSAVLHTHKNEVKASHENKSTEERKSNATEKNSAEENKVKHIVAHETAQRKSDKSENHGAEEGRTHSIEAKGKQNSSNEKRVFFREFDKSNSSEADASAENKTENNVCVTKKADSAADNAEFSNENKRNKKSAENHSDGMNGGNHENNTAENIIQDVKNGDVGKSVKKDGADKSAHTKKDSSSKKNTDNNNNGADGRNADGVDNSHKKQQNGGDTSDKNGNGRADAHGRDNSHIDGSGKNRTKKPASGNKSAENKEQTAQKPTVKSSENKEKKSDTNHNRENKTEKTKAYQETKSERPSIEKNNSVENKPTVKDNRCSVKENNPKAEGNKVVSEDSKTADKSVKLIDKENKPVHNGNKAVNNTNKPVSSRPQSDLEWTSSIVDRIFAEKEDEAEKNSQQNAVNKEGKVKEKPVKGNSLKKQHISEEKQTAGSSDEKALDEKTQKKEKASLSKQSQDKGATKPVVAVENQSDKAQPQNKATPIGTISSLIDKVKEKFVKKSSEKSVESQGNADNSAEKTVSKQTQSKTSVEKHRKTEREIQRDEDLMRAISEAQKQREERLNKESRSRANAVTHKAKEESVPVNEKKELSASEAIARHNTDNSENAVDVKKSDLSAGVAENKNSQSQTKSDTETASKPEENSVGVHKTLSSEKTTQYGKKKQDYSAEKLFDSKISYPRRIAMLEESRRDYNALKNCVMQFNGVNCIMFKECEAFFYDGKAVFFIDEKDGKLRFFVAKDYSVRLGDTFTSIKENSVLPVGSFISVDDDRRLRSAENCIHTVMGRIGVTQNFEYDTVDYYTRLKQKGVTEFLPH